ncbi:hypothetical protein Q3G72_003023 [Acer saccharum]|nr:hypothetical protein Q3G72_003023 [Acer saccharum]
MQSASKRRSSVDSLGFLEADVGIDSNHRLGSYRSMHSSCSFTVEKCFTAGSLSLREAIPSEFSAVQIELSKTKLKEIRHWGVNCFVNALPWFYSTIYEPVRLKAPPKKRRAAK